MQRLTSQRRCVQREVYIPGSPSARRRVLRAIRPRLDLVVSSEKRPTDN